MSTLSFSTLIQEDKKLFLQDDAMRGGMVTSLNNLTKALSEVRELLKGNDYPTSQKWLVAVAKEGGDGLRKVLIADSMEQADRLNLPKYIREQWKRTAAADVPAAMWGDADKLCFAIGQAMGDLPFLHFDDFGFTEEAGLVVDADMAQAGIMAVCRFEITDSFKKEAKAVRSFAQKAREMEMTGLNALELITKYAKEPARADDDFAVYNDLVTRRHSPGAIASDLSGVLANALKQ